MARKNAKMPWWAWLLVAFAAVPGVLGIFEYIAGMLTPTEAEEEDAPKGSGTGKNQPVRDFFRDWFNKTKDDPEGAAEEAAGFIQALKNAWATLTNSDANLKT